MWGQKIKTKNDLPCASLVRFYIYPPSRGLVQRLRLPISTILFYTEVVFCLLILMLSLSILTPSTITAFSFKLGSQSVTPNNPNVSGESFQLFLMHISYTYTSERIQAGKLQGVESAFTIRWFFSAGIGLRSVCAGL